MSAMNVFTNPTEEQRAQVRASLINFARHQEQAGPSRVWATTGGEFPKTPEGHPDVARAYRLMTQSPWL